MINTYLIPSKRVSTRKKIKETQQQDLALKQPIFEVLDLRVTAQTLSPTKPFQLISRLIWYIRFPLNNVLFSNFGADGALTNGIQLKYNEIELLDEPIQDLSDLPHYAYDFDLIQDATAVTKLNMAFSRWSFVKLGGNEFNGLVVGRDKKFEVIVNDDLSGSANTEIHCVVEGWGYM